ncbi:hypothetical protein [Streptomyces sp. LUP30]|uniref:hypothetical protein n=1 Tax=Streptomyces sp. LUP30 TaxID=1890285 RepID=UPI0008516446|nr:hypothetical protein [Streptomyces sp. LUP30]
MKPRWKGSASGFLLTPGWSTYTSAQKGRLYIHAAGRAHRETLELAATFGLRLPEDAVSSAINGHVTLVDVVTGSFPCASASTQWWWPRIVHRGNTTSRCRAGGG